MKAKTFSNFVFFFFLFSVIAAENSYSQSISIFPLKNSRSQVQDQYSFYYQSLLTQCVKYKNNLVPNSALLFAQRDTETSNSDQVRIWGNFTQVIEFIRFDVYLQAVGKEPQRIENTIRKDELQNTLIRWLTLLGVKKSLSSCAKASLDVDRELYLQFYEAYQSIWNNTKIAVKDVLVYKDRLDFKSNAYLYSQFLDLVIYVAINLDNEAEKKSFLLSTKSEIQHVMRATKESPLLLSRLSEIYLLLGKNDEIVEQLSTKAVQKLKYSPLDYLFQAISRGITSGGGKSSLQKANSILPGFDSKILTLDRYKYLGKFTESNKDSGLYIFDDEIDVQMRKNVETDIQEEDEEK